MENKLDYHLQQNRHCRTKISELGNVAIEITQNKTQRKKITKKEQCISKIRDSIKHPNIHVSEAPEGLKRMEGAYKLFEEIMIKIYPNLMKNIKT